MSNDKMREEFEAWYLRDVFGGAEACRHYLRQKPCGNYLYDSPQAYWKCWQASRESLVIELPSYECFGQYSEEAARVMRDGCADAIEEAGAKWVKL